MAQAIFPPFYTVNSTYFTFSKLLLQHKSVAHVIIFVNSISQTYFV